MTLRGASMNPDSALGKGVEAQARWSLRLLGGFKLGAFVGGDSVALPGKRERVLLAYLALSPNCRQPRRKLATLLWGDASDEAALDNLRTCIWGLRKALGDTGHHIIASEDEDLVLAAAAFEIDALAFRRLAAQSDRTALEAAANLYAGEFLDGFGIESEEFESWRRGEVARYRDQTIDVLTRLMTLLGESGETERAIATGIQILGLEPLHEAAVRRLMQLYGESGRRGAAVQLYRTFADALRTELDAEPEAATRLVFAEIPRGGEERTSGPAAPDVKLPRRSTHVARPSDVPGVPTLPVMRPALRLSTSLAAVAGALIVAIALISYRPFVLLSTDSGITGERAASASQSSAISVAVLPFLNLSGDAGQDFFSDGMTEEITAALAKVPDLKVVARTSAFQYKGEKIDVRTVGQALNATHLLEGSVRKEGNRVRITAQLIEVGKGTHLWSESYDGQLSDIFATQEEIARTIVGSLMTPLGLTPGERLVANRNIDTESYQQYLRAKALYRARDLPAALKLLEPVVARAPAFAPAWGLLAQIYVVGQNFSIEVTSGSQEEARLAVQTSQDKAEMAARESIRLDSRNAVGYAVLARVQAIHHGKWAIGDDLFKQALALDPNEPDVLLNYDITLAGEGRLKDALNVMERLRRVEPFVPIFNIVAAHDLHLNGQRQAAIATFEAIPPDAGGGYWRNLWLAEAYAAAGRYAEAADTLLLMPSSQIDRRLVEDAARLLRNAPKKIEALDALPTLARELSFVYVHVGAPDRAMDNYARMIEIQSGVDDSVWLPELAPLRKTERFKALVRKFGLVDFWRARGWPDLCHPVGADDFVCA